MKSEEIEYQKQKLPTLIGLQKEESLILQKIKENENILMTGWAGVGKTLLIKTIIQKYSSVSTKWSYLHASELAVRGELGLQRIHQVIDQFKQSLADDPCKLILVIDQLDVLAKFKNEFCRNLPKMVAAASSQKKKIILIAITNRPCQLGLELFELMKARIEISIPDQQMRFLILKKQFEDQPNNLSEHDIMSIAALTDNFTPCDLVLLARTAYMNQVRSIISAKSFKKVDDKYVACADDSGDIKSYSNIRAEDIFIGKIGKQEVLKSLQEVKPSYSSEIYKEQYELATK